MYIEQEFFYMTTGSYRTRKHTYCMWEVSAGGTQLIAKYTERPANDPNYSALHNSRAITRLPSVAVTPSQFKEIDKTWVVRGQ